MTRPLSDDFYVQNEDDEYLTRVVIDTCKREFRLYSSHGEMREVEIETTEQFMDVLELIRGVVDDKYIAYADPIVAE